MDADPFLIRYEAVAEITSATSLQALENARIKHLSKNGTVPALLARMKDIPPAEKPAYGQKINAIKNEVQAAYEQRLRELEEIAFTQSLPDVTMPARPQRPGTIHPVNATLDRMVRIFRRLGFAMALGPDIETEFHNFDALNTPPDHPARNEQDTFYLELPPHPRYGRYLLRTQTSPVQIRVMQEKKPPIRIISPGRCYRRDEIDATHLASFHQCEGLVVDTESGLPHLKGTLEFFFRELLGPDTRLRFRPHFFPFTEPSYEVDLWLETPGRPARWLEVAGCGIVDPAVFEAVGYDPDQYTGYAFGMGIERIAMILHGFPDLRLLEQNDLRFLRQFPHYLQPQNTTN